MNSDIQAQLDILSNHSLYKKLNSLENIRIFMKYHVFAVWDFMSLLKSVQREVTCIELPWRQPKYPITVTRLINEIVTGEESDVDQEGNACSHYELYLKGMKEIDADTSLIERFTDNLNYSFLPHQLAQVTKYHLDLAMNEDVHLVASAFFFGREKLIPDIFEPIVQVLEENNLKCPTLLYYLKRHIELDGDEHGPMAMKCVDILADSPAKKQAAFKIALESLDKRKQLWDFIESQLK